MLIHVPGVLTQDQLVACRETLRAGKWLDGRASAGSTAARAKQNEEADLTDPSVRNCSDFIKRALSTNKAFIAAALPAKFCPPSFNRYATGQNYDTHNDSALLEFTGPAGPAWVRTDLAATIFLSAPEDYDGGELEIEDTFGPVRVKLAAGDMVLYPSSSQHRVVTVTRGERLAVYLWIQSLVRDDNQRKILRDLDLAIMQLNKDVPENKAVLRLLGMYHNLLRMWSDT
jgi:PKHD-type hydroxylase